MAVVHMHKRRQYRHARFRKHSVCCQIQGRKGALSAAAVSTVSNVPAYDRADYAPLDWSSIRPVGLLPITTAIGVID
jgi:hypothetical protein